MNEEPRVMGSAGSRLPAPIRAVARRCRATVARLVAAPEVNHLRGEMQREVHSLRVELDLIKADMRRIEAHATAELMERDDAVHFAYERRVAAIGNRLLRLEEALSAREPAPVRVTDVADSHELLREHSLTEGHAAEGTVEAER